MARKVSDARKDAGVEYYETLKPSAGFRAVGVKLAVERNKTKMDGMVFLKEIARAGVVRYRVDMSARDASYLGAAGQAYVEQVPQF